MSTDIEQFRAGFEAWARKEGRVCERVEPGSWLAPADYEYAAIELMWRTWIAAKRDTSTSQGAAPELAQERYADYVRECRERGLKPGSFDAYAVVCAEVDRDICAKQTSAEKVALPPCDAPKGPFADYSAEEVEAFAQEYARRAIAASDTASAPQIERTHAQFLAAERAGVSFAKQEKCWNAWFTNGTVPPFTCLLSDILALASQGMSHGLLADDYCSQIVAKISAAAPELVAAQREAETESYRKGGFDGAGDAAEAMSEGSAQGDALDAARYRWWRTFFESCATEMPDAVKEASTASELDSAIDAAIAASTNKGGA